MKMAHHLVDYAKTCDQICTDIPNTASSDIEKGPSVVLTEVFPSGKVCTQVVDEKLLEAYVEKDFMVSQSSALHVCYQNLHSTGWNYTRA